MRPRLACLALLALSSVPAAQLKPSKSYEDWPWKELEGGPTAVLGERVPHFDERMASKSEDVRLRAITQLTYFVPRDRGYPIFFYSLLTDPSPRVRWQARSRLGEHGVDAALEERTLPFEVPLAGLLDPNDSASLERMRGLAEGGEGATAGWAIKALGLIGDAPSAPLAAALVDHANVFVRFCAATALTRLDAREEGMKELRALADADTGRDHYRALAAERLWRLGDKSRADVLLELADPEPQSAYDAGALLEDLTGEFFLTAEAWRAWWDGEGRRRHGVTLPGASRAERIVAEEVVRLSADQGKGSVWWIDAVERVATDATRATFPGWEFHTVTFSQRAIDPVKARGSAFPGGIKITLAVPDDGSDPVRLDGQAEAFPELLTRAPVELRTEEDAVRLWEAFCHVHKHGWLNLRHERVGPHEWRLGIGGYERTTSTTETTRTVVAHSYHWLVRTDPETGRALSWRHVGEDSEPRVEPKD